MKTINTQLKINSNESVDEYRRNAPEVLSVPGAAKFLDVSEKTLLKYVDESGIPFRKLGDTRLFSRDALVKWVMEGGNYEIGFKEN